MSDDLHQLGDYGYVSGPISAVSDDHGIVQTVQTVQTVGGRPPLRSINQLNRIEDMLEQILSKLENNNE